MSTAAFHISSLLEKMTSSDKDFRFMATSDLMSELQKDSIQLDEDSERKVVKMLLRLLEDKNGEVQNLAVKCCRAPFYQGPLGYHNSGEEAWRGWGEERCLAQAARWVGPVR
uniref:Cullin associated and neddylation dissociated 2 (putative) n=1 Tax=Ailuropoda melanoleuca TaxID=9646 RepID=A0A7N5K8L9_AILME